MVKQQQQKPTRRGKRVWRQRAIIISTAKKNGRKKTWPNTDNNNRHMAMHAMHTPWIDDDDEES